MSRVHWEAVSLGPSPHGGCTCWERRGRYDRCRGSRLEKLPTMAAPLVNLGQVGDRCSWEVVHSPERGASLQRQIFKWWLLNEGVLRNETDG